MNKAIILSAGLGSRLQPLTKEQPKCLTEVQGKSILANMLEALAQAGIEETVIVVGHLRDKIMGPIGTSFQGMKVHYAVNFDYASTNTSYSLLLGIKAHELKRDDTLLILEGDVFFDLGLIDLILRGPGEQVTVVERYSPELDGSFVQLSDGVVVDWIHKSRRAENFTIEDKFKTVNIHKFSADFVQSTLHPTLEFFIAEGRHKAPLEFVMEEIVRSGQAQIKAIAPTPFRWFEIDNVEELAHAQNLFSS